MDYSNLRSKTIFDFTSDDSILEQVDPMLTSRIFDKEEYVKKCKSNPEINAHDLYFAAEVLNDPDLKSAVESQFADEIKQMFDE